MSLSEQSKRVTPLLIGEDVSCPSQGTERRQESPRAKPAFQRQCSSPSFVESYARYVERLQQDDVSKHHNKASEEALLSQKHTIKASFPGDAPPEEAPAEGSFDSEKEITDSSFSSWPGTILHDGQI